MPGTEVEEDSPIYQAVVRAHTTVFGEGPEIISEAYISDATYLNRFGVPALNYGPAGRLRTTTESRWDPNAGEHVSIEDLYNCTRVYASLWGSNRIAGLDALLEGRDKISPSRGEP